MNSILMTWVTYDLWVTHEAVYEAVFREHQKTLESTALWIDRYESEIY
jgi:hypothetical protein